MSRTHPSHDRSGPTGNRESATHPRRVRAASYVPPQTPNLEPHTHTRSLSARSRAHDPRALPRARNRQAALPKPCPPDFVNLQVIKTF